MNEILEKLNLLDDVTISTLDGKTFYIFPNTETVAAIEDNTKKAICELENEFDFAYGYGDEYSVCSECGEAVRTLPEYHVGMTCFVDGNKGRYLCKNCVTIEDVEENNLNNCKRAVSIGVISRDMLETNGYAELQSVDSQMGEKNTEPSELFEKYSKEYSKLLFLIDAAEMFGTTYSVWGKNDEAA